MGHKYTFREWITTCTIGEVFVVKPTRAIAPAEIRATLGRKYHLTKADVKSLLRRMQEKGMVELFRRQVRIL